MGLNNKATGYLASFLLICMAAGFFSSTLFGRERRYEIRPEITLPEYKSDMDRVIDAYEKVIDDYICLVDDNLLKMQRELTNISVKLDSMGCEMSDLSNQLETIQRKFGIEVLETSSKTPPAEDNTDTDQQP